MNKFYKQNLLVQKHWAYASLMFWTFCLLINSMNEAKAQLALQNLPCTTTNVTATTGYATGALASAAATSATTAYNFAPNTTFLQKATVRTDANGALGIINVLQVQFQTYPVNNSSATPNTAATRKGSLYLSDGSGGCTGPEIQALRKGSYSSTFNPEYVGLTPNTDYIIVIQTTVASNAIAYISSAVRYYGGFVSTPAMTFGNCTTATITGTFKEAIPSAGSITLPINVTVPGSATFTVSGTNFTGTLNTTLALGQTSVTIPISYDGLGLPGTRTLTISSNRATGTCTNTVTVSGGADFDGDGIADSVDIDDDNDGVPDVTECPSVPLVTNGNFANGATGWTNGGGWSISTVASNWTESVINQSLSQTINGLNQATVSGGMITLKVDVYTNNVNNSATQISSYAKLEVLLNGVVYATLNNTTTSNTATAAGNNGGTVSPTTFAVSNGAANFTTFTIQIPATGLPTSAALAFRFSANSDDFHIDNIVIDRNAPFCDPDNDGISNQFDLDSDGDGCSDAVEAGATNDLTNNYAFPGPYGTNGLANAKETVADNGTINYTSTYAAKALNNAVNGCPAVFACSPKAYLFQNAPTDIIEVDMITGAGTTVANDIYAGASSAGFNPKDNFLWTFQRASGTLARIGSNWQFTTHTIAGLTGDYNLADIDANGIMYLGLQNSGAFVRIDLNPSSPTYLTKLPALSTTATNIADWASCPVDNYIYAMDINKVLYKFDKTTGVRTTIGTVTGGGINTETVDFGAMYMDNLCNLYVQNNGSGKIYKIGNVNTGGTAAILVSTTSASSANDGARCPTAPLGFTLTAQSGAVFIDNGVGAGGVASNCIKDGLEVNTNIPAQLYAKLIPQSATSALDVKPVTNGGFSLSVFANGTYTIILDDNSDLNDITATLPTDILGTKTWTGTITNGVPSTPLLFCLQTNDKDNDGIIDSCDIDDDNDGILDIVENDACVLTGNTLRVGYIPNARNLSGDTGYTFDGGYMTPGSVPKLTNLANFGPGGTVKTAFTLVPITGTITKTALDALNLNVIFLGGIDAPLSGTSYLTAGEFTAIKDWSDDSDSKVVVATQTQAVPWGVTVSNVNANPDTPTLAGAQTTIFNGPFGVVTSFTQGGGFQGVFSGIPNDCGTTVLAKDANNKPVYFIDAVYKDLLIGDVDIFTSLGGITNGGAITSNNDKLYANTWAYIAKIATCGPTVDSDGDGLANSLDIDSDNDGIPDNIEGQATASFVAPSGNDTDSDGLDDAYEGSGNAGIAPVNTDGIDKPDYLDLDSDNAQGSDVVEAGLTLDGIDTDNDGLDDAVDTDNAIQGPVNSNVTTTIPTGGLLAAYPNNATQVYWRTTATPPMPNIIGAAGSAFHDNGAGGGIANDCVLNGTEVANVLPTNTFYANLVSGTTVLKSSPIAADGSYSLTNIPDGTGYALIITNSATSTTVTMPAGWALVSGTGSNPYQVVSGTVQPATAATFCLKQVTNIIGTAGAVFNDNGGTGGIAGNCIKDGNEGTLVIPTGLFVNLLSGSTVVKSSPVAADGSYSLTGIGNGSYTAVLTTSNIGTTPMLPFGWAMSTGTGSTAVTITNGALVGTAPSYCIRQVANISAPAGTAFVDNGVGGGTAFNCIKDGNEGTTALPANTFWVNLVQGGIVKKSSVVATDGSYAFNGVFDGTYTVVITTSPAAIGSAMPTNWELSSGSGSATITVTNGIVAPNTPTSFCLKNCVFTVPNLNK